MRRNLAELQRQMREGNRPARIVQTGQMKLRIFKCNCCGAKRAWGEAVESVGLCEWTPVLHCDRCFNVRRHEYWGTEQHEWREVRVENDFGIRPSRIIENKAFSIQ